MRTLTALLFACAASGAPASASAPAPTPQTVDARFATYNAFLNRPAGGDLVAELGGPNSPQIAAVAGVIQRSRPDVVLLNELDYDAAGEAVDLFRQNYLAVSQGGADPIDYPFAYIAESNTGLPSGFDLDNDGTIGTDVGTIEYANDSFGFGFFPGQFGMAVLSKYPIDAGGVRTFQTFLWKDMPSALLPDDPATAAPADFYSTEELGVFRLSSKSHWDVPVVVSGQRVHLLCAHPTPPIFDGPEDRNGRRNHDEIRFWADYVTPNAGGYIYDDQGALGGLPPGERFVIAGDYNADPTDGDGVPGAIQQLLDSPRIQDTRPGSRGGFDSSVEEAGANLAHSGSPVFDTANFTDVSAFFSPSGNLRVDYCLPSALLRVLGSGVFWPGTGDEFFGLTGPGDPTNGNAVVSSDHRLVYVDTRILGQVPSPPPLDLGATSLEFIGEATLPTGLQFEGTEVGGLSALVYDPAADQYLALSDDRGSINDPRFYSLSIDLSGGQLSQGGVDLRKVVTLTDETGAPLAPSTVDPEGLALSTDGTMFICSEGDANQGLNPSVERISVLGRAGEAFELPYKFGARIPGLGIRNNLAFESLTLTPDQRTLFTATENALFQDGQAALLNHGTPARILRYDVRTGEPGAEFIYWTEQIAEVPIPAGSFATNGLVELLAVSDTSMIAMERSFSVGRGNAIRLYAVDLSGGDDVQGIDFLGRVIRSFFPVQKSLMLDLADLGLTLDNVEGMTLGPILADGRRSLVLVSDNNFNTGQFTQVLAFAINAN